VQENLQALNALTRSARGTQDAVAARVAHDTLSHWLDTLPGKYVMGGSLPDARNALKQANLQYRASQDFKKIERQIEEAHLRADTGKTGDLPAKLKDTFKPLVRELNTGKWRPSADVAAAVRRTATGSTYGLRSLSKLTPQSGIPLYGEIALALAGHPWKALATGLGGAAARHGEQAIVAGRATRALEAAAAQHPATVRFGALNPVPAAVAQHWLGDQRLLGKALRYAPGMALRRVAGPQAEQVSE
jgi:hypothetical protein